MPSLLTVEALAEALRPLIPDADIITRINLARTLVSLAAGTLDPAEARRSLSADPKLKAAYAALAGQQATAGGVPISFAGAQTGDVTLGNVAGRDVVTIGDVTITLPPHDTLRPPLWWQRLRVHPLVLIMGALLPILGLISVIADFGGFRTQITEWIAPFRIESAQLGETLILIAPFERSEGVVDTRPHREIAESLRAEAAALQLTTIRVAELPVAIPADDRDAAQALGDRYNASIVIWGSDTGARIRVAFFNLRQPEMEAAQVQIDETARSQLADPSAYVEFVTQDLPGQITFLTFFGLGQAAFAAENYTDARTLFVGGVSQFSAVQAPPQGAAEAYIYLGWIEHAILADLDASIVAYTNAVELDAGDARAYNNRAMVYMQQGQLDHAFVDITKAVELDSTNGLRYNNRGVVYFSQGNLALALTDFNKATELDPALPLAYYNRGLVYYAQGELVPAQREFTVALEFDATLYQAYMSRGNLYHEQGELALALADYTKAIELAPNDARTYHNRGTVYYERGERALALADYTKAIELDPAIAVSYQARGLAYQDQAELELALADYTRAIELDPADDISYYNRGLVYQEQGEFDLALADYTRAIELNPAEGDVYFNRGLAYYERKELSLARADFATVIRQDPTDALAYHYRGLTYYDEGKFSLALADYLKAIELNPADPNTYVNRGNLYYKRGEQELALGDYTRAIELDPLNPLAYMNRGLLYQDQGKPELARADFRRVIDQAEDGSDVMGAAQARLAELEASPTPAP